MNFLIDITHPGNVHFFKNIIKKLEDKSHNCIIVSRNRVEAIKLLEEEGFTFVRTGEFGKGFFGLFNEWQIRTRLVYHLVKDRDIDVLLGFPGETTSIVSKLLGKKSFSFTNCESVSLNGFVAYNLSNHICTPDFLENNFGKKHLKVNGFFEMAYLHPNYFAPDRRVLDELNLKEKERFFVIRSVAWNALHDLNQSTGFDRKGLIKIVNFLKEHGKVFISAEDELPKELEQYRLKINLNKVHHLLYYSDLFVGDSQTMAIESGLLWTYAIRCNSLVETKHGSGVFRELQEKYGLVYSYRNQNEAFEKVKELINNKDSKERVKQLYQDKEDILPKIIDYILK